MFSTANADSSNEKLELWNKITQIAGDAILELNLSEEDLPDIALSDLKMLCEPYIKAHQALLASRTSAQMREESLQKARNSIRSLLQNVDQKELLDTIPSELVEVVVDLNLPVRRSKFQWAIIEGVEELKETLKRELKIAEREQEFVNALERAGSVEVFLESMRMDIEEEIITIGTIEERLQQNRVEIPALRRQRKELRKMLTVLEPGYKNFAEFKGAILSIFNEQS
ncbi:Oidioi.mRNA.OKI2018_I69.XSR.g13954.t1.cds [Oikopleura dioica]|uniref:Oidioi.mRNA.OKI2018_I69.XSR.g13954.t1.cds n=1 Tax=Oikopleura dioica TaxID=34765 RepID=A0ABN7SFJ7_OIKDI|nr:Oidioi.mRNA.OKI2018_I69.XSR.g13954.t1.cds [Oikopleura dioica]